MGKVKWNAKHDYEYVENYKVLQQAFLKNDIKRYIDVDKLIKAKYQDNLEFLQWMKRFFDIKFGGAAYDPVNRRKGQDLFYILGGNKVAIGGATAGPNAANKAPTKMTTAKPAASGAPVHSASTVSKAGGHAATVKPVASKVTKETGDVSKLHQEIQDLKMNMDTVEQERDLYFAKLRDIELLLQLNESAKTPLTENILKILYASENDKVVIDESGTLTVVEGGNPGGPATGGGTGTGDEQMLDEHMQGVEDEDIMGDTGEEVK